MVSLGLKDRNIRRFCRFTRQSLVMVCLLCSLLVMASGNRLFAKSISEDPSVLFVGSKKGYCGFYLAHYGFGGPGYYWADALGFTEMDLDDGNDSTMQEADQVMPMAAPGVWHCPEKAEQIRPVDGWGGVGKDAPSYGINGYHDFSSQGYKGRAAAANVSWIKNTSKLYLLLELNYYRCEAWFNTGNNITPITLPNVGINMARYPHGRRAIAPTSSLLMDMSGAPIFRWYREAPTWAVQVFLTHEQEISVKVSIGTSSKWFCSLSRS